jgi:16S rRNA C967 or C1407 C5-methylase (RsmB/RsmF family)/NOL1/NOP2/fmu family ribosome biogenesis protein
VSFPDTFLDHLHGLVGFSTDAFTDAHHHPPPTSIRLNPFKPVELPYPRTSIPWSQYGFYLDQRPSFTFDPLFHAGTYYVQEASSQLLEQFIRSDSSLQQPIRALDLCAAPGGKSTHLLSLIHAESLLVSNEVIRGRSGILCDNMDKWGSSNTVITQEDAAVLGKLTGFFDLVLVDAPCSGSGLFRKDPDAQAHWSLKAVDHCAARQHRIIEDIWPSIKENGTLIYSTCSYSAQEDEQVISWILNEFDAELISPPMPESWGVIASGGGYKCWPNLVRGEGFFICAFRKRAAEREHHTRDRSFWQPLAKSNHQFLKDWWQAADHELISWKDMCWGISSKHLPDLTLIGSVCQPVRIGTRLGSWSRADWIPDHALALSRHRGESIPQVAMARDESIRYLQRGVVDRSGLSRGWHLVTYSDHPIGWVKSLGNRLNNYYPSHLRILKQSLE